MNSSFKRNLLVGFGLSLALLIASSIASSISIRNLLASSKRVQHTNEVLRKLDYVLSVIQDAESTQRGFLLTNDQRFLQPFNGDNRRYHTLLDDIKELTSDNPYQQEDCIKLAGVIGKRMAILEANIERKKQNQPISNDMLLHGTYYMDSVRVIIGKMQFRETVLLGERTSLLNRFSSLTPAFILLAALLSIAVTVISFLRVLKDFKTRVLLEQDLKQKDREVSSRLTIIQGIADKISAGDYKIRVDDEGKDILGSLAFSLNKMASSLDFSFSNLSHREWLQSGIAKLNEKIISERELDVLTYVVIEFITEYTKSQIGAFYLTHEDRKLLLSASVSLNTDKAAREIKFGEGLAGQVAISGKEMILENISETEFVIDYSAGSIKPASLIAVPIYYERKLKGVIELASLKPYETVTLEFLKAASFNIGMAIHSARDQERLKELLAETQSQSEELQAQHSELENINAEIEAQAEKLQASEEELRVQQEELQQSNQELEERSRLLEEKNELILERNLEIQSKAEELELSTRYKSEFLANMSHELRTPLNSILLLSRLLTENHGGNLSKEDIEYASVIQSSGNGLLTLIDEILDLSKIESGKMELEFTQVNVDDVSDELKGLFQPVAKDKGIEFKLEKNGDLPEVFETDRLRLEQVLRNLISNALKFTPRGAVTLEISSAADNVFFAVRDTGIGIAKDKQEIVFEAFKQADGSTRRKFGGTGLGLSISRELARLLGGEITLESEEGKGSTFTLSLPKQHVAVVNPDPAGFTPVQGPTVNSTREEEVGAKPLTDDEYITAFIPSPVPDDREHIEPGDKLILIIEDDTAFARSLLDFTRKKGYKGIVAVRGDEGIQLAKQFLPTGILLDVQLPIKSGWQVMDELKSDPVTKPIPVHMMSSLELTKKSISKGAIDFINKPVAFEKLGEIFGKIEDALSRFPRKVLIVEENDKHAQALSLFLKEFNVSSEIEHTVGGGIEALNRKEVDCVILDMGVPGQHSYDTLEQIKKTPGFETLPIIIFTGTNLSYVEEMRIKQYADSIVIKTAHSYQRILDEVSLFLHLVEENKKDKGSGRYKKMGEIGEVLKGKTVLLADDDVRNIFSLTKSLESYGMKVITAVDGKEALSQLDSTPGVNLVLMDMMMPEMDGYESTRRIRGNPKYRKLPVIAVTAKAMTGDREKCIEAGASDYITKPVDVDQLISLLRVWLYE
ncbi:response regulator [Segetibacter sp. 3557_3]|uniref:response regulator n=1 Tax=Segetibacter sp. 3557_3 TaxID=2547429 RepID=UPI001058BB28|nr:response regulator [Segetibacter sp. 3557_3]TDH29057.1 response regulator [Segetibacter sp. 3557_3]